MTKHWYMVNQKFLWFCWFPVRLTRSSVAYMVVASTNYSNFALINRCLDGHSGTINSTSLNKSPQSVPIYTKNRISWYYSCFLCKENKTTVAVQWFKDFFDCVVKSRNFDNTNFASVNFVKIFSKQQNNLSWLLTMSCCFFKWDIRYLENIICDENKNLPRPPLLQCNWKAFLTEICVEFTCQLAAVSDMQAMLRGRSSIKTNYVFCWFALHLIYTAHVSPVL